MWQRTRPLVLERDGYRCHWCGQRANTVDHVKPLAHGGAAFNPANLVACCHRCNSRRGAEAARFLSGARGVTPAVGNGSLTNRFRADPARWGAIRG
jgi:hypothetical protein